MTQKKLSGNQEKQKANEMEASITFVLRVPQGRTDGIGNSVFASTFSADMHFRIDFTLHRHRHIPSGGPRGVTSPLGTQSGLKLYIYSKSMSTGILTCYARSNQI